MEIKLLKTRNYEYRGGIIKESGMTRGEIQRTMNKNDPIFPLLTPKNEKQDFIGFKTTRRKRELSDSMKHMLRVF